MNARNLALIEHQVEVKHQIWRNEHRWMDCPKCAKSTEGKIVEGSKTYTARLFKMKLECPVCKTIIYYQESKNLYWN